MQGPTACGFCPKKTCFNRCAGQSEGRLKRAYGRLGVIGVIAPMIYYGIKIAEEIAKLVSVGGFGGIT
ncbi:hypothetical protein OHB54_46680 (plasmid) [Streptomyces sp. NBC_01007]|nr:hypothetical protein OHB54_46680 [Streptomyces sp. NBC_01007]